MSQKKIGALVKTSLVDFPGRVCATVFLKGCNLRCPYCYNHSLLLGKDEEDFVTFDQVIEHLKKRQNVLSGFVISGGEALLNPKLPDLIRAAKDLGYKIKLDTNGTNPGQLSFIIKDPSTKPDFIAMDLKTTFDRYVEFNTKGSTMTADEYREALVHSIQIIKEYNPDSYEFRTVLVPTLVTKHEITELSNYVPKEANWFFAQFINENCLDPLLNNLPPYTDAEIQELVAHAKHFIPTAQLR
jgi:pyruvate formate lyase activating enzyme